MIVNLTVLNHYLLFAFFVDDGVPLQTLEAVSGLEVGHLTVWGEDLALSCEINIVTLGALLTSGSYLLQAVRVVVLTNAVGVHLKSWIAL